MDVTAIGEVDMQTALKIDEMNTESRELSLNELDDTSGGAIHFPLMLGIAVVGTFFCLGAYIRTKLN
jgi:hypothetical protein